jgi:hypothetical protein
MGSLLMLKSSHPHVYLPLNLLLPWEERNTNTYVAGLGPFTSTEGLAGVALHLWPSCLQVLSDWNPVLTLPSLSLQMHVQDGVKPSFLPLPPFLTPRVNACHAVPQNPRALWGLTLALSPEDLTSLYVHNFIILKCFDVISWKRRRSFCSCIWKYVSKISHDKVIRTNSYCWSIQASISKFNCIQFRSLNSDILWVIWWNEPNFGLIEPNSNMKMRDNMRISEFDWQCPLKLLVKLGVWGIFPARKWAVVIRILNGSEYNNCDENC